MSSATATKYLLHIIFLTSGKISTSISHALSQRTQSKLQSANPGLYDESHSLFVTLRFHYELFHTYKERIKE